MSEKKISINKSRSKKEKNIPKKDKKNKKRISSFGKVANFFGCFDSLGEDSVIIDSINRLADLPKTPKGVKGEKDEPGKSAGGDIAFDGSKKRTNLSAEEETAVKVHSTISNRLIRPLKFRITSSKDKSYSKKVFHSFIDYFYSAKLSSYGALLFIFSVISLIFTFVKALISTGDILAVNYANAVFLLISALSSLALFVNGGISLCDSIQSSRICSYILFEWLGVSKSAVRTERRRDPEHFVFILGGLLLGLATIFISPLSLFIFFLKCLVFLIIFHSPESGCVLAFLVLPICPISSFISLIMQTLFSYLCKVSICKRSFKPTITYVIVFCFGLSFLFASIFYSGNVFSQGFMYLFAISCFILISLLIKNEWWIYRCVRTIRFSTVILSVALIISSLRNILTGIMPLEIAKYISIYTPSIITVNESREMYILLGSFFVMSAFLSRENFSKEKREIRLSDRIFMIIIAISVLLSASPVLMICFFVTCIILSIRKNIRNIFYSLIIPSFLVAMMIAFIPDVFDNILSYCGFTSEFFVSRFENLLKSISIAFTSIFNIKGLSPARISILLEKSLPDSIRAIPNGGGLYFGTIPRTGLLSLLTFMFIALLLICDYYAWGKSKKSNIMLRIASYSGILSLVQLLILGLFIYPFALIENTAYIFIMLGLLYATTCVMKEERNGEIEMPEESYSLKNRTE